MLPPDEAAVRAAAAVEGSCDAVHTGSVVNAAEALAEVSGAWADVSRSFRQHLTPYLLYWRGVLGQCLGQEDRARADLGDFVTITRSEQGQSSLLKDAERRLAWLQARGEQRRPGVPSARVVGVALAGGGAGLAAFGGVLHGATWREAQLTWGGAEWSSAAGIDEPAWERLQAQNRAGFGLLAAGASTAIAGTVLALTTAQPVAQTAWLVPTREGIVLGIAGRF